MKVFMKIACPSCGMHYEVDSSSLGRYFRCTECQTLFLGLNAKSVKEPQFVVKEDGENAGEGAAAAETAPEAGEAVAVEADAEAVVADDEVQELEAPVIYPEQDVEAEKETSNEAEKKKYSITFDCIRITPMQLFGAVAVFFAVLLVVAVVAICVANSRVNNLRISHAQVDTRYAELKNALDKLEYKLDKLSDENRQLKSQIRDLSEKVKAAQ